MASLSNLLKSKPLMLSTPLISLSSPPSKEAPIRILILLSMLHKKPSQMDPGVEWMPQKEPGL